MNQPLDVLRHLLAVELDRLEAAREIERKRAIVFPETSAIVRDAMRLLAAIEAKERGDALPPPPPAAAEGAPAHGGAEPGFDVDAIIRRLK